MPVVGRFRDLADAEVASATLDAAGIAHSLADTYLVGLAWYYSTALQGIRLSVDEADAEEARELLSLAAAAEWPELGPGSADELCPVCHAHALEFESGPRKTLAPMHVTLVPLWLWRSRLRCRACGAWRRVPLRFRPELVMVWLIVAIAAVALTAIVCLLFGYVFSAWEASAPHDADPRT